MSSSADGFYTLRSLSGMSDGSAGSSPNSTPPSTPPSTTHDTSRTDFHVDSLESFATTVEESARLAFPNKAQWRSRYSKVEVLLLRWAEDDLNVVYELEDLESEFNAYGFNTEIWLIPTEKSHRQLMRKAGDFVEQHEGDGSLMIVYYGGHGFINNARQSTWSCKRDQNYATLEWTAVQSLLEHAASDVLILLDCCSAASAAPRPSRANIEAIAACGWETIAPEPGRFSFTRALIDVLRDYRYKPISAVMLHSIVLDILKHPRPERIGGGRPIECRRTPVYAASLGPGVPSIVLSRLDLSSTAPDASTIPGPSSGLPPPGGQHRIPGAFNTIEDENTKSCTEVSDQGNLKVPHVLISVALVEDQTYDPMACAEWLKSFPMLAKYVTVRGVYQSYSVLLIVSVPVTIWDLIPSNPAIGFIGFVTSENLLKEPPTAKLPSSQATRTGAPAFGSIYHPLQSGMKGPEPLSTHSGSLLSGNDASTKGKRHRDLDLESGCCVSIASEIDDKNDMAIARVLQRNEKDALKVDRPIPSSNRPIYTRISRQDVSTETLEDFDIDFQIDQDPDYVLIKRLVSENEQNVLFKHTQTLRRQTDHYHRYMPPPLNANRPKYSHGSASESTKPISGSSRFSEAAMSSTRNFIPEDPTLSPRTFSALVRPSSFASGLPPNPPLPPNWTAVLDYSSSQYYYRHIPTLKTQWEFPTMENPPSDVPPSSRYYPTSPNSNNNPFAPSPDSHASYPTPPNSNNNSIVEPPQDPHARYEERDDYATPLSMRDSKSRRESESKESQRRKSSDKRASGSKRTGEKVSEISTPMVKDTGRRHHF